MPDVIRLLPESIANQIAAGEVVQRPASAVKELIENAIDAQAQSIQVILKEAGKQLIQVIDDGVGMSMMDARMCFERHATSKIKQSSDLFALQTMGFRGEAMASIAAVSQIELRTQRAEDEIGTEIMIEGSEVKNHGSILTSKGTNIQVKNLFFNVPARRNFLKNNAVEMRHIMDEFQRIALANPKISFSLTHNEINIIQLPTTKLIHRIVDIFGKSYREKIGFVEEENNFMKISGYIGKPEASKKVRGEQFFFTNGRFIKSNYLNHAVLSAFEGVLPVGNNPFYVLFIEIDPAQIDVNVHPTKTEIKFEDERLVYSLVQSVVRKSLGLHNFSHSLDFSIDANSLLTKPTTFTPPKAQAHNLTHWQTLYEKINNEHTPTDKQLSESTIGHTIFSNITEESEESSSSLRLGSKANEGIYSSYLKYINFNEYIIFSFENTLCFVNRWIAREKILYEKYIKKIALKEEIVRQTLLFPKTILIEKNHLQDLGKIKEKLAELGFDLEIENEKVYLKSTPIEFNLDEQQFIEGVLDDYLNERIITTTLQQKWVKKWISQALRKEITPSENEDNLIIKEVITKKYEIGPFGQKIITRLTQEQFQKMI